MIRFLALTALLLVLLPTPARSQSILSMAPAGQGGPVCDTVVLKVKNVSTTDVAYIRSIDYSTPLPAANWSTTWTSAVSDQTPTLDDDFWVMFSLIPVSTPPFPFGFARSTFCVLPIPPGHEVMLTLADVGVYYVADSTPDVYANGVLEVSTVMLGISPPTANGFDLPPFGTSSVLGNPRLGLVYQMTEPYPGVVESYCYAAGRPGIHHRWAQLGQQWSPLVSNATVGETLDVFIETASTLGAGNAVGWVAMSLVPNDPALPFLGTYLRINDLNLYYPLIPTAEGLELSKPLPTTLSGLIGLPLYLQDFVIPFNTFQLTSSAGFVTVID